MLGSYLAIIQELCWDSNRLRDIPSIMEDQMDKNMKHEMETALAPHT